MRTLLRGLLTALGIGALFVGAALVLTASLYGALALPLAAMRAFDAGAFLAGMAWLLAWMGLIGAWAVGGHL